MKLTYVRAAGRARQPLGPARASDAGAGYGDLDYRRAGN